jgi:3-oxoacid CoA-transferase subunit A
MLFITGDTHRDFRLVDAFCNTVQTTKGDVLMILGDAGINYLGGEEDRRLKRLLAELPVTLFCIHGNHEQRPETLGYTETARYGGTAYWEPDFPDLLFAKDGEIYGFDGKLCIAIGGAYSIDKSIRLAGAWAGGRMNSRRKRYGSVQKRGWKLRAGVLMLYTHTHMPLKIRTCLAGGYW